MKLILIKKRKYFFREAPTSPWVLFSTKFLPLGWLVRPSGPLAYSLICMKLFWTPSYDSVIILWFFLHCHFMFSALAAILFSGADLKVLVIILFSRVNWKAILMLNLLASLLSRAEQFVQFQQRVPIATKVVCFSRLLKCLRSLYGKQCEPRSDCSYRSSLFWVYTVCFYT